MNIQRNTHVANTLSHMRVALKKENPEGTCFLVILTGKEINATDVLARDARTLSL